MISARKGCGFSEKRRQWGEMKFTGTGPHPSRVSRRRFLRDTSLAAAALLTNTASSRADTQPAYSIQIAETAWEIAPKKTVHTAVYNAQAPGPILRLREGQPVAIEITNKLDRAEIVHWHGQWIPSAVDGAMEEGSPMIAPGATTRIAFTPQPSGLHWYHTHTPAKRDLKRGLYSGQFGVLLVEPRENPARYDQEQFLVLHEWEPYFVSSDDGSQEIEYRYGSINGRMLGAGEPLRVRAGERVLLHVLNASATLPHWLALPGHTFQILALDGRPVPTQAAVPTLRLAPAERVTALVTMNNPGVWVLGEADAKLRESGTGIVVEYAGQSGPPRWIDPSSPTWNYAAFGNTTPQTDTKPDVTIPLVFTSKFQGHGALNRWMINGKSFPDAAPIALTQGLRHRLIFDNRSMDDHPVHLHRHAFELRRINGAPTSGVTKDVVLVKAGTQVEADLIAANPGLTLFHCHQQDHMDLGFMTLFHYN